METSPLRGGRGAVIVRALRPHAALVILLAVSLLVPLTLQLTSHRVTLCIEGQSRTTRTFCNTVSEVLAVSGVNLREEDWLSHRPWEKVRDGMVIEVVRSFPLTVLADGDETVVRVAAKTTAEVLLELGIYLKPLDRVSPAPEHTLVPGDVVSVTRVYKYLVTERTEIPYREIRRGNAKLDRGETKVIQRGKSGLREDTAEVTLENGTEVSRQVVQSENIRTKQDRIIEYGENTMLSRGGRTVNFSRVEPVIATAYCPGTEGSGCPLDSNGWSKCTGRYNDGRTAYGFPAVPGNGREDNPHIVAVDPRVIPLGSRLYIDGYGYAVAADVGSAIIGKRIDILHGQHEVAWKFGRKRLRVYVLP